MNYSICLLGAGGCTQRTSFGPFEDDAAALAQARTHVCGSPIVEVWKDYQLGARLFRDPPSTEALR
ncbi:hypothetical protein ATE48_07670 [Candidatus Viadribacter manganicus]|uniref:Uncharacterized protein n=1 Tax=Candidatus Viadribacter manganicus TaxID=1759059 RepID=A0A1B1AGW5_9PROT|nr:hypothetical protein ATE48_07670 [Candidatus Viadribacter manganicus]